MTSTRAFGAPATDATRHVLSELDLVREGLRQQRRLAQRLRDGQAALLEQVQGLRTAMDAVAKRDRPHKRRKTGGVPDAESIGARWVSEEAESVIQAAAREGGEVESEGDEEKEERAYDEAQAAVEDMFRKVVACGAGRVRGQGEELGTEEERRGPKGRVH